MLKLHYFTSPSQLNVCALKKYSLKHTKVKNNLRLRTELRSMKRRHTEKYKTLKANKHRLQASAIPYMQRIMNQHDEEQRNWCKTDDT